MALLPALTINRSLPFLDTWIWMDKGNNLVASINNRSKRKQNDWKKNRLKSCWVVRVAHASWFECGSPMIPTLPAPPPTVESGTTDFISHNDGRYGPIQQYTASESPLRFHGEVTWYPYIYRYKRKRITWSRKPRSRFRTKSITRKYVCVVNERYHASWWRFEKVGDHFFKCQYMVEIVKNFKKNRIHYISLNVVFLLWFCSLCHPVISFTSLSLLLFEPYRQATKATNRNVGG